MKAISLWQPWASLIAIGAKSIETRSWPTNYRGPLAVHAAKRRGALSDDAFEAIRKIHPNFPIDGKGLPSGCIVATCELAECRLTTSVSATSGFLFGSKRVDPPEWYFGDYSPGRYAWILRNIKALPTPVPCMGHQGFFDWTPDAATIEAFELPLVGGAQ